MTWDSTSSWRSLDLSVVGNLAPREVLYEFEVPCIFTADTPAGVLVLAYLSEDLEQERTLRFIVTTTSPTTVQELKTGVISVRDAFDRGSLWVVDCDYRHEPQRAFSVAPEHLPADALPDRGTMLWPQLEPAFVVKLKGAEVLPGSVPSAALTQAAEIGATAFKPVFEWAARAVRPDPGGRPPEWLRLLFGLPTQRFSHGSLEVAFGLVDVPEDPQTSMAEFSAPSPSPRDIQREAWAAIAEGLAWSVGDGDVPRDQGDKWLAILEALKRLAPNSTGPVTSIEVSGRMVGRIKHPYSLDRASTKRIRSALTELKKTQEVLLRVFTGRVRDLDLDKLTFILRDVSDQEGDLALQLDNDQLLETAREAHYQELEVSVAARRVEKKAWIATDIEFVQAEEGR